MKIGILGSGDVGKSLSRGFLKHGYEVMIATRDASKLSDFKKELKNIKVGTFQQTADFGEILVLCVKGTIALEVLKSLTSKSLNGKTIIDATNPIADSPPQNGVLKFFTNLDKSLMESLQEKFPKSNFVKSFNSIGSSSMVNPSFSDKPTMFICGNNESSKNEVKNIVEKFGFEPEDMGKAEAARAIEPLCMLWCIPGFLNNDWVHAFKLLKK